MQLYLLLRVHFTTARLFAIGILDCSLCGKCSRDYGDLYPFDLAMPRIALTLSGSVEYYKLCVSDLDSTWPQNVSFRYIRWFSITGPHKREAAARALFQARRVILWHWKSADPPSNKEWVKRMGENLRLEKYIYQHKGRSHKFDNLWGSLAGYPRIEPAQTGDRKTTYWISSLVVYAIWM